MALAAEKGVDFKKLNQKKKHKAALKEKRAKEEQDGGAPLKDEDELDEAVEAAEDHEADEDEDDEEEETENVCPSPHASAHLRLLTNRS